MNEKTLSEHAASLDGRDGQYREMGWWPGEKLQDRYRRLAASRPDDLAVADSRGRRMSHLQLTSAANEFGEQLQQSGVGPGDVVLVQLPNWVEWQVVFLAMLRVGAVPATIPLRTDAAHLLHVSELVGARALVVAEGDGPRETEDRAVDIATRCRHALDVLIVTAAGTFRSIPAVKGQAPSRPAHPGLDHVMFTSSTTGRPKAVMHTADTLAALNLTFSDRFGLGRDTPIFMPSPLGHSVGAIHGARLSLFNASALILQERWDADEALSMVHDFRCVFTAAATPFLSDLLDAPQRRDHDKLESMRWFLCGGAPVPPAVMDRTREEFPSTRVTVLWGMTEGGVTTCVAETPWTKVRSTCGIGLPGLKLRVLDADGAPLPTGSEGELVMRGPGVFVGYLGQEDLYESLLTSDGDFRTGDLATLDEEGYLRITGRAKDLIIRGGVNISPVPIEDAIAAHPNVASVAVVGVPDLRLGERLCVVIQPRGRRPDLQELVEFARSRGLPKYHWPEFVHYVEAMPRTPAGKIRKVDLRAVVEPAVGAVADPETRQS